MKKYHILIFLNLFLLIFTMSCYAAANNFGQDEKAVDIKKINNSNQKEESNKKDDSTDITAINPNLLNEIERQQERINQLEIISKTNEKSINNYYTVITFLSGGIIALVALVLGIGIYRFYMDNKRIIERVNSTLDKFLNVKKEEFDKHMKTLCSDCEKDIIYHRYSLKLEDIINKDEPNQETVYSLLSPLCENPKTEYEPLFTKIKSLNIHPDINKKISEGLAKLEKNKNNIG